MISLASEDRKNENLADALSRLSLSLDAIGEILFEFECLAKFGSARIELKGEVSARWAIILRNAGRSGGGVVVLAPDEKEAIDDRLGQVQDFLMSAFPETRFLEEVDFGNEVVDALVVDDDSISLDYTCMLLKKLGCRAVGAQSGGEALARCSKHDFGFVVMDLQMPGINGLDTTRILRNRVRDRDCEPPFVLGLSANTSEKERAEALESGMDDFRLKPITLEVMREVLLCARGFSKASLLEYSQMRQSAKHRRKG